MAYTPLPYDDTKPISTDFAGNMYLELQALKQRMNFQVGTIQTPDPDPNLQERMLAAETNITDIAAEVLSNATAIGANADAISIIQAWQGTHQAAYDAFVQAEADWKAQIYTIEQAAQDTIITDHSTRIGVLEQAAAAAPAILSGTGTPAAGLGNDGDVYFQYT